jgi:hypothetical protein
MKNALLFLPIKSLRQANSQILKSDQIFYLHFINLFENQ